MASGYVLSEEAVLLNNRISAGAAIASCVFCLMILIASGVVWMCPPARSSLNRISFRLLLWTMLAEVLYDISYATCVLLQETSSKTLCSVTVFGIMALVGVTNYLLTCIALNLMLVLVFGVNVVKLKMERWYLAASFGLGIIIPTVAAAKGKFGWDDLLSVCWIRAATQRERVAILVLSLYAWQILSCFLALVFVLLTLITLYRQRMTSKRFMAGASLGGQSYASRSTATVESGDETAQNTTTNGGLPRKRRTSVSSGAFSDRFTSVAIRVSAYPIALIFVNAYIAFADLQISVNGVSSHGMYVVYCIYYFLYGARGGIFAAIALFVDPSLTRGLHIYFKARRDALSESNSTSGNATGAMSMGTRFSSRGSRGGNKSSNWNTSQMQTVTVEIVLETYTTDENGVVIQQNSGFSPSTPSTGTNFLTSAPPGEDRKVKMADDLQAPGMPYRWDLSKDVGSDVEEDDLGERKMGRVEGIAATEEARDRVIKAGKERAKQRKREAEEAFREAAAAL